MMDMPANCLDQMHKIDWDKIKQKVEDYKPALKVIQGTWSKESILDIANGRLFVPDSVMNDAIANSLREDGKLNSLVIASKENGRIEITADAKNFGKVELSGELREFVHKGDTSYAVYRVRERNLPGHGLMSWIFSRISMSMAQKLVGHIKVPDDMAMEIHGNRVRVDYSKALAASDFGQTQFEGHRLIDMIEIKGAQPKEGGVEFQTELHVPKDVRDALIRIAKDKMMDKEE